MLTKLKVSLMLIMTAVVLAVLKLSAASHQARWQRPPRKCPI